MSAAIVRTLSFLLLIVIGFLLKKKITKEQSNGLKQIILNLALPAVIFISLQKVDFSIDMMMMPFLAILFNFLLYFFGGYLYPLLGLDKSSEKFRTIRLLLPSLAPGLSCFPFLLEYAGPKTLADAAFTDVGNKIFVLVILYAVSMRFFGRVHPELKENSKRVKFAAFLKMMLNEPVNLAIISALILVSVDLRYTVLPLFIQQSIDMLGGLMTPLILLYIGLSIKLTWKQAQVISSVLLLRSALAFLVSALLIFTLSIEDPLLILLIVLFPQSSSSFWPVLHISSIQKLEEGLPDDKPRTFDYDFAMNMLAMSLPFSSLLILGVCTFQESFNSGYSALVMAVAALLMAVVSIVLPFLRGDQTFRSLLGQKTKH